MTGLDGRTAIITGAATLIGATLVRAFAAAGTRVVAADIDRGGGQAAADGADGRAIFVPTDVRSDADCEGCVSAAIEAFGSIDFLINVACVYDDDGLDSSRAAWITSFDVNVIGGVMLLRAALPHLRRSPSPAVVNLGSVSAKIAQTGRWTYPASKAAVVQVTRSEAMDLAPDGIRVNSVSPGWVWSRVMHELSGGDRAHTDSIGADFHLVPRVGDPREVAQVVLFLCSDVASFITGADIAVDGGYSAMGPEQAKPAIPRLIKEPPAG